MRFNPGDMVYYLSDFGFVDSFTCLGIYKYDNRVFGTHFECIPLDEAFRTEQECEESAVTDLQK